MPWDKMFGTFRDKLKESGTLYKGGSEEKADEKTAMIHDSKASLKGLPEPGFAIYMTINCFFWILLWFGVSKQHGVDQWSPHYLAFWISFGPLIVAQVMANLSEKSKRSILYPFHKEGWFEMSLHLLISTLVCVGPVYVMVHMLLSEPGNSFYYWIRT